MVNTWMRPAGESSIPATFLVDGAGRIAWIGEPEDVEGPLKSLLAGTYDLRVVQAERAGEKELRRKLMEILEQYGKLGEEDPARMLKVLADAAAQDPRIEDRLIHIKFLLLAAQDSTAEQALALAKELAGTLYQENSTVLNFLAWSYVDPKRIPKTTDAMIAFALETGRRADELEERKNAAIADTYARALFLSGQYKEAYEVQQRAVGLLKKRPLDDDNPDVKARLEEYRKAAGIEAIPPTLTAPEPGRRG